MVQATQSQAPAPLSSRLVLTRVRWSLSEDTRHDDMTKRFPRDTPVSAGFVRAAPWANNGQPFCTGHSETLGLSVETGDTNILQNLLSL
jgi:hypothetical protein